MADAAPQAPLYEITSQAETFDRGPSGSFVQGVQVAFRTRSGATGSVFVPYAEYTVERARAMVGERAAAMDAVQLTGREG